MGFLDGLKDKAGTLGDKAREGLGAAKDKAADLVQDVRERFDSDDAPVGSSAAASPTDTIGDATYFGTEISPSALDADPGQSDLSGDPGSEPAAGDPGRPDAAGNEDLSAAANGLGDPMTGPETELGDPIDETGLALEDPLPPTGLDPAAPAPGDSRDDALDVVQAELRRSAPPPTPDDLGHLPPQR